MATLKNYSSDSASDLHTQYAHETHFLAGVSEQIEEDLEEREVGEEHLGTLPGRVLLCHHQCGS